MVYIQSYKELIVWQKAIELVKEIYLITNQFPQSEIYGIISQMRRASISIPSNIAEGYGRKQIKSYVNFYAIAYGSALELETQLIISKELKFISQEEVMKAEALLTEVCKILNSMITKMKLISDK